MISEHCSPQICTCSPTWKLPEPCPFGGFGEFITRARLVKSLVICVGFTLPVEGLNFCL